MPLRQITCEYELKDSVQFLLFMTGHILVHIAFLMGECLLLQQQSKVIVRTIVTLKPWAVKK